MFYIWYPNFGYAANAEFDAEWKAIEYGVVRGYEFHVYRKGAPYTADSLVGWWSPIGGYHKYGDQA